MREDRVPFSHPWPEKLLGSVAKVVVGGTPSTAIDQYWGGSIPWMASGDIHLGRIFDVPGRITDAGLNGSNAVLVEPDAVAMALAGQGKTRGTVALTKIKLCTNQSVALISPHPDELLPEYLYQALIPRYDELRSRSAGGGRGGLTKAILEQIPVQLPSLDEQRRIAEVLSALDEQIGAVGSEIMKQKSVLDGLLDRLLLDGLRNCKLGDYVEISPNINTQMPSQMTPFIPMESVSEDGHIYDWSFRPWSEVSSGFTRFSSGDVLVAKITPCFENGKGAQVPIGIPVGAGSTEFHVLRAKQGVCPRWIYWHTRVREFRIAGAGRMTGSAGQQRVPRDFIESFAVKSVSEKEQIEITACLDSVDVVIQLLIKEQEKLRLQKQGLMRDLLTGAVRVTGGH